MLSHLARSRNLVTPPPPHTHTYTLRCLMHLVQFQKELGVFPKALTFSWADALAAVWNKPVMGMLS